MDTTVVRAPSQAPESLVEALRQPGLLWTALGDRERTPSLPFTTIISYPSQSGPTESHRVVVTSGGLIRVNSLRDFAGPDQEYVAPPATAPDPDLYAQIVKGCPTSPAFVSLAERVQGVIKDPLHSDLNWSSNSDLHYVWFIARSKDGFSVTFNFSKTENKLSVGAPARPGSVEDDYIAKHLEFPKDILEMRSKVALALKMPEMSTTPKDRTNTFWSVLHLDVGAKLRELAGKMFREETPSPPVG